MSKNTNDNGIKWNGLIEFALKGFLYSLIAFGYFAYGNSLDGVFGTYVIATMLALSCLLGVIPFVGYYISRVVMLQKALPWSLAYTGLAETWITHWLVSYYSLTSILLCVIFTLYLIYYGLKFLGEVAEEQRKRLV